MIRKMAISLLMAAIVIVGLSYSATARGSGSPLANQTWVRMGGPLGGLGYDIRMRPDNLDIMYVTDAWAGVHISTDSGRNWEPRNQGIDLRTGPSSDAIPVFCLTIDPNNYNTIWIGLQNLGAIYRSEDGGQTWQKRTGGIVEGEGLTFRGISVQPGNSDVVYAAGEIDSWHWAGRGFWGREFDRVRGVVYKSTDGGESWKSIWRGDNLARYILIDPTNVDVLYISTGIFDREAANSDPGANNPGGAGVLKSTDGGRTWQQINQGLQNLYVGSLFMHPQNPQILLAGIGNNAYPNGGGIYLTTNGGANWKYLKGSHITSVEISSSNPNVFYAGGQNELYRSDDGGVTWQQFTRPRGWGWGPEGIAPGFPIDFQVDPRDPMRIFANNYGGGNFLSEDGGKTWVSASNGYTGADLTDLAVNPDNPAIVFVVGRSGPFKSVDGGLAWEGISPSDPEDMGTGATVSLNPANPNQVMIADAQSGLVWKSTDGSVNWTATNDDRAKLRNSSLYKDTNMTFQGFDAVTFAPSNPSIVYAGYGIWRCATEADTSMCHTEPISSLLISQDGGNSWNRINGTSLDGVTVTDIVVHPTDANIAWAATGGGGVFYTEDRGNTWVARSSGLGARLIMDLAIDPSNPAILYAASATNGVYKTENGGNSWKPAIAGMDANESIGSIVVDPTQPNIVYAGSWRSGVFLSEDGGERWVRINNGLRTRSVRALAISSDGGTLYAGTRGEGVFRLSIHGQDYFNALAPTPTPIPATAAPKPTVTPQPALPIGNLPCCGSAAFSLALLYLVIAFSRRS
jgi:photosystem II stability/assembly factor-like uncharacterized protein